MYELVKSWAQIAPAFTLLVALCAVLVAWRQLTLNRNNQRETTAKAVFREYLKLAFDNPDLAAGGKHEAFVRNAKKERYEWFVAYFLWAAEEILDFAGTDKIWWDNLLSQAKQHRDYLNKSEFRDKELGGYSEKVKTLVERAIEQTTEQQA
jgi:hypothetical protein